MDRVHKTIAGTRHTVTRQQVLAELARYDAEYPRNDYCERGGRAAATTMSSCTRAGATRQSTSCTG
jgi:hypothetical protein